MLMIIIISRSVFFVQSYTFASGLVVKNDYVIGIQPTDKNDEYYVHTTTPQYYKINKTDYWRFIGDNFRFDTSDPVEAL